MIKDIQKRAIRRTQILGGQIKGLEKMIEQEVYCMDILTQSLAIQKSLQSLNALILENHLKTHIKEMYESGDAVKAEAAEVELLRLFELYANRSKQI